MLSSLIALLLLPAQATPTTTVETQVPAAQEWTLRYQFKADQKIRYQTHQNMTLETQLGENVKRDVSELKQRRVFTVLSTEESGTAELAMQFEHVWMKMQSDDREPVVFDTGMKASEVPIVFRNTAHQLKGSAPKYRLSNIGKSLFKVRHAVPVASGEIAQAAFVETEPASESGLPPAAGTPVADRSLAESPAGEKDPGSFLIPLPEKPIKIGETWKESVVVPVRLTQEINRQVSILRTFRLDSVENGIATISFRSSIESSVRGPAALSQLIQATPQGTVQLDLARGLMLRREMRFNETVIGVFGNESVLSSVGTNTEVLIEPPPIPSAEPGNH